jgi:O-antigen/teichoic acid export membrane protein
MADARLSDGEAAGERVAFNTIVRAVGEVVGKLASLVLFAALGRTLGEDGLGVFVFGLSFAIIVLIPIDLGFDRNLVREVAADRSRIAPLTGTVLTCKFALMVPAMAVALVVVWLLDLAPTTRDVVLIMLLGQVFESLGRTAAYVFMALERSGALSVGVVVQRVLAAGLGIAALAGGLGVSAVAWAYTIGAVAGLTVSCVLLNPHFPLRRLRPGRLSSGEMVRTATFALQDIATLLLFRVDAVILAAMASTAAVGRYGAAYRIFESTWFITVALFGAFVAMFSYLDATTQPTLKATLERAMKLSFVTLVPCTVAFALSSTAIIRAVFGADLAGAAGPLRILAPAVVLLGVGAMATTFLMSQRRARPVLWISLAAVVVNIGLNVALIPGLDARGSAVAMLVTEAGIAAAAVVVVDRVLGGLPWPQMLASTVAAGVAMAAVIALLGYGIGALVAGVAAYLVVLIAVERTVNPADVRSITAMVRRRLPA